ncbi:ORF1p [Operophtera brumata]|uniref:ORF1p n=1 Tax=Operophtera brumata TaxID=104452 RepID=A0A0L7LU59_OPEBR|nr:ORF1p [Operophtera brumata]
MNKKKRTHECDKEHLLKKIRKLEKKIRKLPDSVEESDNNEICEEGLLLSPVIMDSDEQEIYTTRVDHQDTPPLGSPTQQIESSHNDNSDNDQILDDSVLNILGAVQSEQKGATLHKEIANRWTELLTNGLKKEEKEEISKSNLPFQNCPEQCAPKLNPEVKAALPESARKRDQVIESRQKQISTVLSCLGSALQGCVSGSDVKEILKKVNQASRLISDTLYLDSRSRRSLVLFCINKDMKDSLQQTRPHEYLFGKNLSEQIKTAKSVQKSVQDLKVPQKKNNFGNRNTDNTVKNINARALNWRGPPRQGGSLRGQQRQAGGPTFNRGQTKKEERPRERHQRYTRR